MRAVLGIGAGRGGGRCSRRGHVGGHVPVVPFRLVRAIGGSLEDVQASVGDAVFPFSNSDVVGQFCSALASSGPFPGT